MNKFCKSNLLLFTAFSLIFTASALISLIYGRTAIHIFFNRFHTPFFDEVMKIWTWLGDGVVLAAVSLIFIFISFRYAFIFFTSFLLSSFLTQFLKHTFFAGMPRPLKYFEGSGFDLYIVSGIKYNYLNSFPSGHAASAFALFFGLALLVKNKMIKLLLLILACSVAYSRVYLSQHFFVDITFGSLIGVVSIILSYFFFLNRDNEWMDKSIISSSFFNPRF